jgi:hypothetical protein
MNSPFEDPEPLPLSDDIHASFDIVEYLGKSSLARGTNAGSRVDDHDAGFTDPQIDAMLLEMDKCRPDQGRSADTEVDDHDD